MCIYCTTDDATHFGGVEHVIPQSFGTFGSNTPTLSCVCDRCNGYFGRSLDQNLARETLEGISRYIRSHHGPRRTRLDRNCAADRCYWVIPGARRLGERRAAQQQRDHRVHIGTSLPMIADMEIGPK